LINVIYLALSLTPANTARSQIRASVSHNHWLTLSRPGCLVQRWSSLTVQRRSPIQALTGPGVE